MTDLKKLRELAVAIRETDFESEDFNDTLLIDRVTDDGVMRYAAYEIVKSVRDFIAAANPQAIIEVLDRLERYERALEKIPLTQFWAEAAVVAREALEGGKP